MINWEIADTAGKIADNLAVSPERSGGSDDRVDRSDRSLGESCLTDFDPIAVGYHYARAIVDIVAAQRSDYE